MASTKVNVLFPVGRVVMGSLYKPNTTDAEGKPLVVKTGPNAGQPRTQFFFAVAIAKGPETHWAQTAWGAELWKIGHTAFPNAAQSPSFAWKVEDGDSAIPNKRGRKPCEQEGFRGHWVVKFSNGFAPKVYKVENGGFVQVLEADFIKPGYFVEVSGTIDGNGSQSQPGIYINSSMVCFRGYGEEISFGPDVNEVGFGKSALPAGASATPAASSIPMPAAAGASVGVAAIAPPPVSAWPAPVPVHPNPAFLQIPPAIPTSAGTVAPPPVATTADVPAPAAPGIPAPPVPSAYPSSCPQMTTKAQGVSYAAYQASGWTDAQLIANGLMVIY